jgi:HEAT repeat protein
VDAWRESDSAGDVPRLLELAAASPSEELRAAASAAQERITAEAGAHEDLSGDVADLVDPDPHSRQAARRNFIEGDAPVRVQDLITLVESHFDDGTDLSHVVEVLGHLADPAATAVLARLLGHDNWETRGFAVTALGALGDDAVDPLCEALHRDPELMVRARAVKSLERFEGNPRAGAVITRAVLGDPTLAEDWDERVVRPAGRALGQMDYRDAIPDLIAALEHDCAPPVQRSVAWALGELRAAESANALRELLEDDPVEPVQRAVAWALGVIRDPEAVPILLRVLEEAADVATRSEAAFALGEIKDPAAIPALLAALDGSSDITSRAAWALGQLRGNEAIGPLLEALRRETDSETRAATSRSHPRTSMFDLAHSLHTRNSGALFLRAERQPGARRTYRLIEGEPLPTSYGEDLYRQIFGRAPDAAPPRSLAAS